MLITVAPSSDGDRADFGRELDVGAGRVHRRELDVLAVGPGQGDGCPGLALDVLAVGLQLVLDVDVGGRDERVDARPRGVRTAPQAASMSALWVRARPQITGPSTRRAISLHGLEVTGRGDREAGLDHVDPQARQLLGDLDLLGRVQRDPGRLLAVPQGRVEDVDAVGVSYVSWSHRTFSFSAQLEWPLSLAAIAPPSAIPPEGGGEGEARRLSSRPSHSSKRVAHAGDSAPRLRSLPESRAPSNGRTGSRSSPWAWR